MIARIPLMIRLLLLILIHGGIIGWMIWDRAQILRTGTEVRLSVRPIDPRDLFRGDYVILSYDISRLNTAALSGDDKFDRREQVFVTLERRDGAAWQPIAVHRDHPDPKTGQIIIAGTVNWSSVKELAVSYGIESYFVPEGTGRDLERKRDKASIDVLAAIAPDGRAAIKGLYVDGKLEVVEPLL